MDYVQFMNDVKMKSDSEVQLIARSHGIDLSKTEIRALRPLLNEVSFHWVFTGIPESFIDRVRMAIGDQQTEMLFRKYLDAIKNNN